MNQFKLSFNNQEYNQLICIWNEDLAVKATLSFTRAPLPTQFKEGSWVRIVSMAEIKFF